MFRIRTTDAERLKRIAAAGSGGILLGLFLIGFNLVSPFLGSGNFGASNLVFGLFGTVALVFATHPTYQAVRKLDES